MERVLILGSEGFIGKKLQEKLEKENCRVWGYDRMGESSNSNLLIGEFKTEDRLYDYIRDNGIDTVFHLISTTYPKEDTSDIPEEIESNVIPTVRFLESIKSMDGIRLVFVSSGGTVYGESNGGLHNPDELLHPICGYGAQKAVIETYMNMYRERYNLDCRIARLSNVYGFLIQRNRGQGVIPILLMKLMENQPAVMYGDTIRDYIYMDDAINALYFCGKSDTSFDIINIGTGEPVRLSTLMELIQNCTGKKFCRIEKQPIRSCDVRECVLDVSETKRLLSWEPAVSLESGILKIWRQLLDAEDNTQRL